MPDLIPQSPTQQTSHEAVERQHVDRRRHGLSSFIHCFYHNRRIGMRRFQDENMGHYVDVHGPLVFACAVSIVCLSLTDSFFTLLLLKHGAVEINPVMDYLIRMDSGLFITTKLLLTAACIVFIVGHRNFWLFKIRGNAILYLTLTAYLALINYELALLSV